MKSDMNRRHFLKITGKTALAAGGLSVAGCMLRDTHGQGQNISDKGTMTLRTNPNSSDKVSLLGYGCMRWPMIKNEDGKDIVDQEKVNLLVDHAISHGVNYFDSAPVYLQGQSESATGEALSRHPRESYFIATKLSNHRGEFPSKEDGIRMYHDSMKAFRTDYIDYYLLHALSGLDSFERRFLKNGLMDFLLNERKEGRIRNLGFSFHGGKEGFDQLVALHGKYHWDFVQIQLNYIDWRHAANWNTDAEYLQGELDKKGIQSVIMEPLLGGRLAKLPDHIAARLKERDPQRSLASWAFRFAGSHKGVLTVLSGMTYMEHLQDNIKTFSPLVPLVKEDFDFLEETAEIMQNYPTIPCNDCQYCMPCPYGVDIPGILLHYNKCVNDGVITSGRGSENYRTARRAYLVSYGRAVPELRQADRCIGCGQCVESCPQGIDIPKELHKIDGYIERLKRNTLPQESL